jgi:hypothetical protein
MDIDSALEKAAEHLESVSAPDDVAAPVHDTVASDPTPPAAEPAPSTPPTDTRTAAERARDEQGKFIKVKGEKPSEKPVVAAVPGAAPSAAAAQGKPGEAVPSTSPGEPVPRIKAPQSLTPAEKEAYIKADPVLQKAIERRERETQVALNEADRAKKLAQSVHETLSPFEGLARANGMDSVRYAGTVMQTAAALHMGTPQQKAAVVASLIHTYGIDVDQVNAVMQGQAPAQAQPPPQQDVGQLVERAIQQKVAAATEARAAAAWQEFQASEPEFLEDVKADMREILMVAGQQGRNMTYQQAYDRACKLNEDVASQLAQRKAAQEVRTAQPVTPAARAAAGSARSRPATAPAVQPRGIDAAMRAAAEKLGIG